MLPQLPLFLFPPPYFFFPPPARPPLIDARPACKQAADTTYDQALEAINNMGSVVDALYEKAKGLSMSGKPAEKAKSQLVKAA